jgi:putative membrane protein
MKALVLGTALIAFASAAPAVAVAGAQLSTTAGASSTQMLSAPLFVEMAAMSDLFEIQSSQAALKKSKDASVQRFAQTMIEHHTKMSADLKSALQSANVKAKVPTSLSGEKAKMLKTLSSASGEKFDAMYVKAQLQAHEQALQLMQSYAQSGDNPALRQFAQQGIPIIQQHLQLAQQIAAGAKS